MFTAFNSESLWIGTDLKRFNEIRDVLDRVVHHVCKCLHRARRVACERERGVIAGHEHHAVEQLLDRIRLSGAQIHRRALDRRVFRQDLDRFPERTVLEHFKSLATSALSQREGSGTESSFPEP